MTSVLAKVTRNTATLPTLEERYPTMADMITARTSPPAITRSGSSNFKPGKQNRRRVGAGTESGSMAERKNSGKAEEQIKAHSIKPQDHHPDDCILQILRMGRQRKKEGQDSGSDR